MKLVATIPAALFALFASLLGTSEAAGNPIADRIDAYAQPLVENDLLSGCLVVTREGATLAQTCFGCQNAGCATKNSSKTRFCMASLTKPMTAVAILRLVEQNKLHLEDTVDRWIDSFPSGDSITVSDLLQHRAGVPHRVTTPEDEVQRLTPADIVDRIKKQGLMHPPHTQQSYSSAGYTVLAYIMERVTGVGYGDAMRNLVFEPLGMKDTFHPDGRTIDHRAISFVTGATGLTPAPPKDYAFLAGAGSLYSTPHDVARFANACLGYELLSKESWEKFQQLGWMTQDIVQWSGHTNGFGSWLEMRKKERTVAVFLGNAGTGGSYVLRDALPALVAGKDAPPPPKVPARTALSAAQMQGLEGRYVRTGTTQPVPVEIKEGVVYMGDNAMYPIGIDRFFNPAFLSETQFSRGPGGTVSRIEVTAPGLNAPLVFERIPR